MAEIFDFGFQKYRLKLSGVYNQSGLFAVVGDTARRIEVQLLDAAGRVTDTTGIELSLSTPVGQSSSYVDADLIDASKGLYQVDLTNGLFLKPGKQDFQWRIHKDGKQINSVISRWHIYKNVSDGGNQSFNFYLNVDDLKSMQQDFIDDTVKSEALKANVEERYSNLEADYAQDLSELKQNDTNFTAQLAQTRQEKISHGNVSVSDIDKNLGKLDQTYMTEELLQQMVGNTPINAVPADKVVTNRKLTKESVRPENTTFFKYSKNLFNSSNVKLGFTYDTLSGELVEDPIRAIGLNLINVNSGDVFVHTVKDTKVAFFDESKNFITLIGSGSGSLGGVLGKVVVPSDISGKAPKYMALVVLINDLSTYMCNEGGTLLPYESYSNTLRPTKENPISLSGELIKSLPDGSITPEKTSFIGESTNLYNSRTALLDTSMLQGEIIAQSGRMLSDFIRVSPGERIYHTPTSFRIFYFDSDKRWLTHGGSYIADNTTLSNNPSVKYIRLSPITVDHLTLMVNRGDKLLPFEEYGAKIKQEYLPDMSNGGSVDADEIEQIVNEKISSSFALNPYPPRLSLTEVRTTSELIFWLSEDGEVLFGRNGSAAYMSLDEWETTSKIGASLPAYINGIRELPDGELILSTNRDDENEVKTRVFKSSGFDRDNPSATIWNEVLELVSSRANIQNPWGFDYYENIVVLSEYGTQGVTGGNFVYLSKDYGNTFTPIFDLKSQVVEDRPTWTDKAHTHTVAYDPYFSRIWLVTGDSTNRATYYTDDLGESWKFVKGSETAQFTGIIAMEDCVVFGTDSSPNGLYIYHRKDKSEMPVIKPWFLINDSSLLTHAFGLPFRRNKSKNTPVYFSASSTLPEEIKGTTVIMGFVDGKKAHILYESEEIHAIYAGAGVSVALGNTAQGNIIIVNNEPGVSGNTIYKAPAPIWE